MVNSTGLLVTRSCKPRQAWKGATVAVDVGTETRTVDSPPYLRIPRRGVRVAEGARLESVCR